MNIFEEIYQKNSWNGTETRSGPGSGKVPTQWISNMLTMLCNNTEMEINSVLDVGCGEAIWQPKFPEYVGLDVSSTAIHRARELHPGKTFEILSIETTQLEPFDLVLCRDVFQHLSFETGLPLMDWVKEHTARWLLVSTFTDGENVDIPDGFYYRPDMRFDPWNLGAPLLWIADGFNNEEVELSPSRDTNKFLGLWEIQR